MGLNLNTVNVTGNMYVGIPVVPPDPDFVIFVRTTNTGPGNTPANQYRFHGVGTFDIDWGDGNIDYGVTGTTFGVTHTYATGGDYEIRARNWSNAGLGIRYNVGSGVDRIKLLEIRNWGSTKWTSMVTAFKGCSNMVGTFTDAPDLSNCTSLLNMFGQCSLFNSDISNWDVSTITNMSSMFGALDGSATSFNQPLNAWNVSNVTNMSSMFFGATSFNQPLHLWNVSNVSNMNDMFGFATSFDQNIGMWSLNSSVNLTNMLRTNPAPGPFSGGMSTENYSLTLIGWANNPSTPSGRSLGATSRTYDSTNRGGSPYDNGTAARAYLVGTKGWSISGDASVP